MGSLVHLGTLTPTHLCRFTVRVPYVSSRRFSWCSILFPCPPCGRLALTTRFMRNGFANPAPLRAQRIIPGFSEDARTRHSIETYWQCRNIHLLSIDYAFRPRLRSRLTQGRFALPWKPWVYGEQDFHLFLCYLCRHSHFAPLHGCSRSRFSADANAPLPLWRSEDLR